MPWLVKHAANIMNRYQVKKNVKTAYEMVKGRKFRREVAEFGECIMYIVSDSVGKDKRNTRWEDGVFVGIRERSGEILIGTSKGVVKARAFRRKGTEGER